MAAHRKSGQRHDDPTPPMLSCAGAGSWWAGVVVSVLTRKGSTWESLAQETSAISTTENAETRIIDLFMAGTVVDAAGQFNHTAPCAVKRAGIVDGIGLDRKFIRQSSARLAVIKRGALRFSFSPVAFMLEPFVPALEPFVPRLAFGVP